MNQDLASATAPRQGTQGPEAQLGMAHGLRRFAGRSDVLGLVVVYVALFVYLSIRTPYFLTSGNISDLLREMAVLGIIAVGETLVILRAEIDLSVGSVLALSAVIASQDSVVTSTPLVIVVALSVGILCGLVNGIIVASTGISSLVVTLGTMTVASGLALVVTGGAPRVFEVPFLEKLGQGALWGVPIQFVVMVVVGLVVAFVLRMSVFGRSLYATGDNDRAARLNGVRVGRVTVSVFALSGGLAAVGGLLYGGQFGSADPTIGVNLNLLGIAAVVIGGTSLFGGVGGVIGTLLGTALIATLQNGLVQLNVASAWQEVVTGVVIVLAVLADRLRARARER